MDPSEPWDPPAPDPDWAIMEGDEEESDSDASAAPPRRALNPNPLNPLPSSDPTRSEDPVGSDDPEDAPVTRPHPDMSKFTKSTRDLLDTAANLSTSDPVAARRQSMMVKSKSSALLISPNSRRRPPNFKPPGDGEENDWGFMDLSAKQTRRTLRNSQFLSSLDLQQVVSSMTENGTLGDGNNDNSSSASSSSDDEEEAMVVLTVADISGALGDTKIRRAPRKTKQFKQAKAGSRRNTTVLHLNAGVELVVTNEAQQTRRRAQMRRRSLTFGAMPYSIPVTMMHELRQYYDINYRVFLVKAQLRTLAASSLKLSPYISRVERMGQESQWLFSLVDEDNSGLIDAEELKNMIEQTGQTVKDEELEHIMEVLDADGSGEVDDMEFKEWYMADADLWMSRRRRERQDEYKDTKLLQRESMRYDRGIKKIIDVFWKLVDVDGNGEIDLDEYIELSLNLQQSMWETEQAKNKGKKKKKGEKNEFNQVEGRETAIKEWQMDSQGFEFLDYSRFQLCFFQIADAWANTCDVKNYTKVLSDLLNRTSTVILKGRNKGTRRWKWAHGDDEEESSHAESEEEKGEEEEDKKEIRSPKSPKKKTGSLKKVSKTIVKKMKKEKEEDVILEKLEEVVIEEEQTVVEEVVVVEEVNEEKKVFKKKEFDLKERKPLFAEQSPTTPKREFTKRGDSAKQMVKKEVREKPPAEVFDVQTVVSETISAKKRRAVAENFKWEPDDTLFSPPRMRAGVSSGGGTSYTVVDEVSEKIAMMQKQQQKGSARKLNLTKAIFAKSQTSHDMREKMSLARRYAMEEETERFFGGGEGEAKLRILNKFGDSKMLWKMIALMRERILREEGVVDEESLGFAATALLEGRRSEGEGQGRKGGKRDMEGVGEICWGKGEEVGGGGGNMTVLRQFPGSKMIGSRPATSEGYFVMTHAGGGAKALDQPGIGPLPDTNKVVYPVTIEGGNTEVMHQNRGVVTGIRDEKGTFVSGWDEIRRSVEEEEREEEEALRRKGRRGGNQEEEGEEREKEEREKEEREKRRKRKTRKSAPGSVELENSAHVLHHGKKGAKEEGEQRGKRGSRTDKNGKKFQQLAL